MADRETRYDGPERRENGNGFFAGLPTWAKVLAQLVSIIGIPGTIAFYLVYLVGQTIPNILTEVVALKAQAVHAQTLYQDHMQQTAEQTRLLQRICSRVSKTDAERQQCFDR